MATSTEGLPPPQVFQDKVKPQDAPVGKGGPTVSQGVDKLKYVAQTYVPARKQEISTALASQPTKNQAEEKLHTADEKVVSSKQALNQAQSNVQKAERWGDVAEGAQGAVVGALHALGLAKGTRTVGERTAQVAQTQDQLEQAQRQLEQANQQHRQAQSDREAVQYYPREYLKAQLGVLERQLESALTALRALQDEKVPYSPMLTTSNEMTMALRDQDLLQEYIRLSERNNQGTELDEVLPLPIYRRIRERIGQEVEAVKQGRDEFFKEGEEVVFGVYRREYVTIPRYRKEDFYRGRAPKELERAKVRAEKGVLAFNRMVKEGIRYAEEKGLIGDEAAKRELAKNIARFAERGAGMYEDLKGDRGGIAAFVQQRFEGAPFSVVNDPYVIGCYQMEKLFDELRIPQGEARVPYVLAYAAGFRSSYDVRRLCFDGRFNDISRDGELVIGWLSDVLTSSNWTKIDRTQPKAQAVYVGGLTMPFNLGHSFQREIRMKNLGDAPVTSTTNWTDRWLERDCLEMEGEDTRLEAARIVKRINVANHTTELIEVAGEKDEPQLDFYGWNLFIPGDLATKIG
jgi:hypothetical protein